MQQVDEENLTKLGQKVSELRKQKSQSLNKFVISKGFLTAATWSRIENGKFDLKFSTLLRVAHMLDMKISDLLKLIDLSYEFNEE